MIRSANRSDVPAIFQLIEELASYERAPEQVVNTPQQLEIDLFDERICSAIVATDDSDEVARKKGYGQALFDEVVRVAKQMGVKRMDWQVLDWNHTALNFYRRNQATLDPEWINGRLFFE